MRYILLIYTREADWTSLPKEEQRKIGARYGAYTDSIKASGHHRAGNGLERTTHARTVRVRNGRPVSTDGPFAETREQLGGYYVVEARDLDEACALAARIPGALHGAVEVRPIMEM